MRPKPHRQHLSRMRITAHLYLPTLDHRAGRPQPILYMAFQHARFTRLYGYPHKPWALTPRFHRNLVLAEQWAVIFCGTISFFLKKEAGC